MIDHDALARQIAENLTRAHYLVVPFNSLNDVSAWDRVVAIIATSLREVLPTSEATTIRGIGPDGKPMNFRLAAGRMFENVCPDCGETNGGGIDSERSRDLRQHDKYDPCNIPCMHCGKGPMQVVFLSDEDEQYTRDVLNSASKNQNYEKPRNMTPEQAGIAKKLVNIPSAVWSETASSLAHQLLRELLES